MPSTVRKIRKITNLGHEITKSEKEMELLQKMNHLARMYQPRGVEVKLTSGNIPVVPLVSLWVERRTPG